MKKYSQEIRGYNGLSSLAPVSAQEGIVEDRVWEKSATSVAENPERFSETNVQVNGIDEPDILKTNGKQAFYSPKNNFLYSANEPMRENEINVIPEPDYYQKNEETILDLNVFPLEKLGVAGKIKNDGKMLLEKNMLTVLANDGKIYGYDVSAVGSPEQKWKIEMDKNSHLISSRLMDGKIYLVVFSYIQNRQKPCPIQPLKINSQGVSFGCEDIFYVEKPIGVDGTFQIMQLDPPSGRVEKKVAFAGNYQYGENLYMSPSALYLSYGENIDQLNLVLGFVEDNQDFLPVEIKEKLEKLASYDISQEAKTIEVDRIIKEAFDLVSSDDDARKKQENEFENRMKNYSEKRKRDFTKTGIVKISAKDLEIEANGVIPGKILNQFSIDEYKGYLRVATTIGENFGLSDRNENDIYILDKKMNISGKIQGLGVDERIYSARFVGDRGYLVTFKKTDPFFVLDLFDPKKPEMKGELKIPGYSSYLHSINSNLVLGIGEENGQVKVSLFDVSDSSNPFEKDKYILKEYWSEIANTHHAFFIDDKNKVFFLPGGTGGYVFGYENDKLTLKKAIDEENVERAIYINNYLYIFSKEKLTVLDEKNWEKVKDLDFTK